MSIDSDRHKKLSAFSNDKKNPAVKLNKKIREKSPELSLTNLGRLDFPLKYSQFELEKLFFVPSTGPFLEIVLGVVTVGRKLTITINFTEKKISKAKVEAIKDQAKKYLDSNN